MRNKGLLVLSGLTVAALGAAGWAVRSRDGAKAAPESSDLLLDEFDVNAVTEVAVTDADGTVTLALEGEEWGLVERGGYPADFKKIKGAIVGASRLIIEEPKTSKPENFAQLGVDGPDAPESKSALLTLRDGAGATLAGVIVGEKKFRRGSQAVYVRREGDNQVYLCEGTLDVDADPKSWIEKDILRLEGDRVQDVKIAHADGEEILIGRDPENHTQFLVENLPPGREAKFDGVANSVGTGLSYLGLEDVQPASEVDFGTEPLARAEYRCHDGLIVDVESARFEEQIWIKLQARYEEPAEPESPEEPDAPAETREADDPESEDEGDEHEHSEDDGHDHSDEEEPVEAGDEPDPEKIRAEVDEMNARFATWAFAIQDYKGEVLARRMEDLLKELEEEPEVEPVEGAVDLDEAFELSGTDAPPEETPEEGALEEVEDDGADEPPVDGAQIEEPSEEPVLKDGVDG